jgi:hypothetical protein
MCCLPAQGVVNQLIPSRLQRLPARLPNCRQSTDLCPGSIVAVPGKLAAMLVLIQAEKGEKRPNWNFQAPVGSS